MTTYFDQVFLINLKHRQDRLTFTLDELAMGGVDVSKINRFDAFPTPQDGMIGATRSHRTLWRLIAGSCWKRVLILEDDIQAVTTQVLKENGFRDDSQVMKTHRSILDGLGGLTQRFWHLTNYIPNEWDILYLGAGYGEPPISRVNAHVIRCGFMQCCSSYGISNTFAKILDAEVSKRCGTDDLNFHPGQPDNVLGWLSHDHRYYCLQPRLLFQRASYSDITKETHSYLMSMSDPYHENLV